MISLKELAHALLEILAWICAIAAVIASFAFIANTKQEFEQSPVSTSTPEDSSHFMRTLFEQSAKDKQNGSN